MEIKSERLKLTKLKQKDLDFLYKMASEPLGYFYDADEVQVKIIYIKNILTKYLKWKGLQ